MVSSFVRVELIIISTLKGCGRTWYLVVFALVSRDGQLSGDSNPREPRALQAKHDRGRDDDQVLWKYWMTWSEHTKGINDNASGVDE